VTVKVRFIIFLYLLPSNYSKPVCQFGCTECADDTGDCIACKKGYTKDENDNTKCDPMAAVTTKGVLCPDGSYNAGDDCALCSTSCSTCIGKSPKNCTICASGLSQFQGRCVPVGPDGVCAGTGGMIADNNKQECDGKITFY
jgi:hypothetical protein